MNATPEPRFPTARERRVLRAFDEVLAAEEPVPPRLLDAARELYVWRSVDAELLELLVDSAEDELTTVRDDHLQRFVAFGNDERGVHFECTTTADGRFTLDGMVVPAGHYEIRADRPGAEVTATSDEHGSFRVTGLAAGSVRLTLRAIDGELVMSTPWFMLER